MSYEFYKLLHLTGVFMTLFAIGGMLVHAINGGTKTSNKFRKGVALTHGVGLAFVLVAGFGLLARLGLTSGIPTWAIAKLVIWLMFGGIVAIIYRKPASARALWLPLIVLAVVAAFLAVTKPI